MANCYKLVSCRPDYYADLFFVSHPDIELIYNTDPTSIIAINGDLTKGYTIEKYVRSWWYNIPYNAYYTSALDYESFVLTNFIYNGTEYVSGFVGVGTIADPDPISLVDFLNEFVQAQGLDLNFVIDGSGFLSILIKDSDTLEFNVSTSGTDGGKTYGIHEYDYNGNETSSYEFDGTAYSSPAPGFTDVVDSDCDTCNTITAVAELTECPSVANFNVSLEDAAGNISIDDLGGCLGLAITDESTYNNTVDGHDITNFTDYIRIEITRGDNTLYVMSSIAGADVDEVINAPASHPSHYYPYNFVDTDVDGIYNIYIETYPTWDATVAYNTAEETIVYRNGSLYKLLVSNTGDDPELVPASWELYEATNEEALLTRYADEEKVVVLCRKLNDCEEKLVHEAFCLINSNFCNDDVLCKNPVFMKANKYLILKKALEYSIDKKAWNEVEKQINLLKTICCC